MKEIGSLRREPRASVAFAAEVPIDVLDEWGVDRSWRVRAACAAHEAVTVQLLVKLAGDEHPKVRERVAAHASTPREVLWVLADDPSPAVVYRVAIRAQETGDAELALELVEHGHADLTLLTSIASGLSAEALQKFAGHSNAPIRAAAAAFPNAPSDVVTMLAVDAEDSVRAAAARRSDLEPKQIRSLSRDCASVVRAAIAANPATPERVLTRMGIRRRRVASVERALATNPSAGRLMLTWLSRSRRWDVRSEVAAHPRCPITVMRMLSRDSAWAVPHAIAAAAHTPPRMLVRYANHRSARIKLALAGNIAAPEAAVTRLLADPDGYVRGKAAAHPAARPDALVALVDGMNEPAWVLRRVAVNPSCPPEIAEELLTWLALGGAPGNAEFDPDTCATQPDDPSVHPLQWFRQAAAADVDAHLHPLWAVRQMATSTRQTIPYTTLHQLAQDPRVEVRRTTARFDGMAIGVLRQLSEDADPAIAQQAQTSLQRRPHRNRARSSFLDVGRPLKRLGVVFAALVASLSISHALNNWDSPRRDVPAAFVTATPGEIAPMYGGKYLTGGGAAIVGLWRAGTGGTQLVVRIDAGTEPLTIVDVVGDLAVPVPLLTDLVTVPANAHLVVYIPAPTPLAVIVTYVMAGWTEPLTITIPLTEFS